MIFFETHPTEVRLVLGLGLVGVAAFVWWRWPGTRGKWWLFGAAAVALWTPITGRHLPPMDRQWRDASEFGYGALGDLWLPVTLVGIHLQSVCLPAWNARPARRWLAVLLGSWALRCALVPASGSTGESDLAAAVAKFGLGTCLLGFIFGLFHKLRVPPHDDWLLEAGWNLSMALLVGLLALLVLTAASSGYIWTAPAIVLGILGGCVAVGIGVTLASHQRSACREPAGSLPEAPALAKTPPTPTLTDKDLAMERATMANLPSGAATSPADSPAQCRADTGASPAPPVTPNFLDPDGSAPTEATGQRFSFGAFVAACFVMVLLAWLAVDLVAPDRGPLSPHVTPLGTHDYLQDQAPVNRTLALGIASIAMVIAKVAWRPGWRSFAAGILVSGLLLALLALGLHK